MKQVPFHVTWANSSTSDSASFVNTRGTSTGTAVWACYSHVIRRTGAKGSNGFVHREQGACIYCGKRFERKTWWRTKHAGDWTEA